jgi:hypothetical protein
VKVFTFPLQNQRFKKLTNYIWKELASRIIISYLDGGLEENLVLGVFLEVSDISQELSGHDVEFDAVLLQRKFEVVFRVYLFDVVAQIVGVFS